jgi:two-component system, chemotaxis family, sensor histidine kinase and response regulator PixL
MNDKELEIRRHFLDEAQDYLDALDDALLGAADRHLDIQKINSALRAAHSIKGGAGMMGFDVLSALSHRLEDSFKVLKVQNQLDVSADLEALLLGGVHSLRQVIEFNRLDAPVDEGWLATDVMPIFDQLYEQLGEPQAEDAASMLAAEDGRSVIPVLFETEVEGCLQRLESVLGHPDQPCLLEEMTILAQELGGLGEMLQLTAFSDLCESVLQNLEAQPDRTPEIAHAALEAWRYSQTLVLSGEFEQLPTAIAGDFVVDGFDHNLASVDPTPVLDGDRDREWQIPDQAWIETNEDLDQIDLTPVQSRLPNEPLVDFVEAQHESFDDDSEDNFESSAEFGQAFFAQPSAPEAMPAAADQHPAPTSPTADYKVAVDATSFLDDEDLDATVRVPVRQLNRLSDLFGEFTIERNGLDLYLKRMRGLTRTLSDRLKLLEQSNTDLRSAYNKVIPNRGQSPSLLRSPLDLARPSEFNYPQPELPSHATNSRFDILEMDRYDTMHLLAQQVLETIVQVQEVTSDIDLSLDEVDQTTRSITTTSKHFQTSLTNLRMRPLSDVLDRFPRALREMALQHGKKVKLNITGGQTLIDRNILEALNDPLMHLLRNAFDHGIADPDTRRARGKTEEGTIEIRAMHRGNRTIITLSDDGNGIAIAKIRQRAEAMGLDATLLATASDEDLLSLIFEPGFSTSDQVTALSGRGVGLDVVRDNLKQVRGEIGVSTQAGLGTTFTLSIPFTLSIVRVLLVESGGMLLAFPADTVNEIVLMKSEDITTTDAGELLRVKDKTVPLMRLGRWLRFNCPRPSYAMEAPPAINVPAVLMVTRGRDLVAVQIDRAWTEQEAAVRRVEGNLPLSPGFSGCTVFGDGRVVPLVNVSEMLNWISSCERSPDTIPTAASFGLPAFSLPSVNKSTILIVDDSINVRRFLALTLERSGYRVEQAKDGQEALDKLEAGLGVSGIICDVEMPRLDGFGFLAKMKANPNLSTVPIAMLTSRSGDKHRQLATSLGAAAYFSKPYNEQVLLAKLAELVKQPVRV